MPDILTRSNFEELFTNLVHDRHVANRFVYYLPPCYCTDAETEYGICKKCYGLPVQREELDNVA